VLRRSRAHVNIGCHGVEIGGTKGIRNSHERFHLIFGRQLNALPRRRNHLLGDALVMP
jgi:hypothetical protein